MGCPFPLQTHGGRGSGLLRWPDRVEVICGEMRRRPEVAFSVKMRLGQDSEEEGLAVMDIVNAMPLLHLTLHPRLGRQQYKGVADREAFLRLMAVCRHPMVYNGDVRDMSDDVWRVEGLKGVMVGRGLLARPWMTGDKEPREVLRTLHAAVYRHATQTLCGDSQIVARLHAFWEYLDIPSRAKKPILKASSLRRYNEAVAAFFSAELTVGEQ
jgi:tRNA-dihydrouridine synthase